MRPRQRRRKIAIRRVALHRVALRRVVVVTLALGAGIAPLATAPARGATLSVRRPFGSVCQYSHSAPDDPIVAPGQPGVSHLHDFFGNTTTDASSTAESLALGATTCRYQSDLAAYWAPALYADGLKVTPLRAHAYYARRTFAKVQPPPSGLRIVAGGTARTVRFTCIVERMPKASASMARGCPQGAFSIGIKFPDCWNGTDLDSADHRSHMAYSQDGVCPATHPVAIARLQLFVAYPAPRPDAALTLASGALDSAHADFFNAWDPGFIRATVDFCLNGRRERNCAKRVPRALRDLDRA